MCTRPSLRYQDFVDQQRAGIVHGVFIDDTGSPGLANTPAHLSSARKTWAAVIVPKSEIAEVWSQLPDALSELRRLTGATEFHFADIYMGRREFKDVPLETRLAIFGFMAYIFRTYNFPVIVQTLDPQTLRDIRGRADFPERLGPFNLAKHEDLALFFLLLRVNWHLQRHYPEHNRLASVFVDEGYKKNGAAIRLPSLEQVFSDGLICFAKSDTILPLQLADFAAFCLNRSQLLLGKPELSDLDRQLLGIIQGIVWNYQNIPKIPLDDWFRQDPTKQ